VPSAAAATIATAPAASATAAASTAAPTASAKPATAAATAFTRRTRFVHDHVAPHKVVPIERFDRTAGVFIGIDFDEAETARLPRETVANQGHIGRSDASLPKPVADVFFASLKRKIAHIEFFHRELLETRGDSVSQALG
jgi:hypothetical protein